MIKSTLFVIGLVFFSMTAMRGQSVPAPEENIPFLVTFGKDGDISWGDDDFIQTFFFVIPVSMTEPFYIRVFDPTTGGQHDEMKAAWNTITRFSIYGGVGCYSNPDARNVNPVGKFKSGSLLTTKVFNEEEYDNDWYTFGPFNPKDGEFDQFNNGHLFKVIAEGVSGDDGNLYRYFLSTSQNKNIPVEGGNAFTYEYTFRMHDQANQISHIYPYVDSRVISIKQSNFDWDNDGYMKVISKAKAGLRIEISGEKTWSSTEHKIEQKEHNSSLDFQFIKSSKSIPRNNVVISIQNQYGETLPFYTVPIGGIPKYVPGVGSRPSGR